ncbi:UvrD-helicase domain-containing protein [Rubinisphaera sp. JC750]|uniref:UvrD-helicase domain-containing protein n=1 Tax=Rubinisphaera sp. JC750 TaxID=2898658 RepID=UPI001F018DC8|nr:UvrD-helicase domain-containing protein [Rubinisphaera sp. JC750]
MPYTPQQAQAIQTRDVSIALAAGAGCGKTFVLTQRFVTELLQQPSAETLSGLMAITFTDRAAREMRDRIREAVRDQLLTCEDADQPAWQEILQNLETARVQTIHAFCGATLRTHATELGLDPDFGMLDEPTAAAMRNQVIQSELSRLLRERNADLQELILRYGLEGTMSRLQSLVLQRFQLAEARQVAADEAELEAHWREYHQQVFLPERMRSLSQESDAPLLFSLLRENECTAPKMSERRIVLLGLLEELERTGTLSREQLEDLKDNAKIQGARENHWPDPEVHHQVKEACERLRKEVGALIDVLTLDEEAVRLAARYGMQALRITESVVAAYEQAKQDRAMLDFDDLLLNLRDLLQNRPAAKEQLQKSTKFLLLDEFQDTDPVQSEIVRAICGDRLTSGGLFLVGDVKQSIYRFRRADPTVFRQLRSEIPQKGQLSLTNNFRSQQGVLDFVNFLFGPAMGEEYDALEAFDQTDYPPAEKTEFLFANDPELTKPSAGEARVVEAEWIAARIEELLSDPTPRVRKRDKATGEVTLRRVEPGDITVLFRAFSNLGLYEDALRKRHLDYYVVAGRAFFAQQEVFDMVNLCRYLDDDTDETALVGVLRSPLFGWNDDTIMQMGRHFGEFSPALLSDEMPAGVTKDQASAVKSARRVLRELLGRRLSSGIGPLLRFAVEQTAYDAALMTEFLGERKVANLRKLLDMADDFDQVGFLGMSEFADRLLESISEEAKEELAATHPESGNVVRLMTVHQSKGLEFPVVFVADVNRPSRNNTDTAVLSPVLGPLLGLPRGAETEQKNPGMMMHSHAEGLEDQAESIRLFYVATTRAADLLILSAYFDEETKASGSWMKLLQERFDLQTGLPHGDQLLGQTQQAGIERDRIPRIAVRSEIPQVAKPKKVPRKLKLADWDDVLATTEPVAPPAIALPLEPDRAYRERFSVSELESVDSSFHGSKVTSGSTANEASAAVRLREAELLGNLLHAALEQFDPELPPDNLSEFIERLATGFSDYIAPDLRETAVSRFRELLDSDFILELKTAGRLYRETEFLLRWSRPEIGRPAFIAGTVDCLLQDSEGAWHLIDYKTGNLPAEPSAVVDKFGLQMTLYAKAIEQLTGNPPRSIRIVQVNENPRTVKIDLTAERIRDFEAAIDQAIVFLRSNPVPDQPEQLSN